MNIDVLERIRDHIVENPTKFWVPIGRYSLVGFCFGPADYAVNQFNIWVRRRWDDKS